jgi:hypothetical protein
VDIPRTRLATHRLVPPYHAHPADAVRALLAVQAQDYAAGLWAIGQRTDGATRADVEAALATRALVRTWPMRGTLHVVAADDVRWLLALLAPRVLSRAASRYRQLGLDAKTFAKAGALLEKHLAGGTALTRPELFAIFTRAKLDPRDQRGIHILGHFAMRGLVCFAAHRGKQPTFALLDEWLPRSRVPTGDEALGELARRYFHGHGPATIDDLAWWSGLTQTEARRAVDIARADLESHDRYWSGPLATAKRGTAQLLSAWDEYTVGYRDRSAIVDAKLAQRTLNGLAWVYAIDGRIAGTWSRNPIALAPRAASKALDRALARYQFFFASAALSK